VKQNCLVLLFGYNVTLVQVKIKIFYTATAVDFYNSINVKVPVKILRHFSLFAVGPERNSAINKFQNINQEVFRTQINPVLQLF
jgi:hypothetical protein